MAEGDQTFTCIERGCGKEFTLTESEIQFYKDKGLYLPKRCSGCRARRKREKERQQ